MKLAALVSGGKDSLFSVYKMMQEGHSITYMVTIRSLNEESYMFHSANIDLIDLVFETSGIRGIVRTSTGEKEKELVDLRAALEGLDIEGVVTGAWASEYQATRVKTICDSLGLKMFSPLWHREPEEMLLEMCRNMDIIFVKVAAYGLDETWLGRKLDADAIRDLVRLHKKYRIHIAGEGGEYETFVLDAPFYKKRIEIIEAQKIWKGDSGIFRINKAKLVNK